MEAPMTPTAETPTRAATLTSQEALQRKRKLRSHAFFGVLFGFVFCLQPYAFVGFGESPARDATETRRRSPAER